MELLNFFPTQIYKGFINDNMKNDLLNLCNRYTSAPIYFPNKPGFYYKPTSGTGIIFPGWLDHETPFHESDNERIIVVGNIEGTGSVNYPQRPFLDTRS